MIDIEVWADVRCPWCWIGLHRLQRAKAAADQPVRIHRRSFLLEPQGPEHAGRPTAEVATSEWGMTAAQWEAKSRLIRSAGSSDGLRINVDGALMFDSSAVHRLLELAAEAGGGEAETAWDAAVTAHFEHNEDLGDPAVLRALASRSGLDDSEVERALAGECFGAEVTGDVEEAARRSVTSVPTVIADDGHRVSGNVSVDELSRFLATAGAVR